MYVAVHRLVSTGCHGYLAILWLSILVTMKEPSWCSHPIQHLLHRFCFSQIEHLTKNHNIFVFLQLLLFPPIPPPSMCFPSHIYNPLSLFLLLSFAFLTIPPLSRSHLTSPLSLSSFSIPFHISISNPCFPPLCSNELTLLVLLCQFPIYSDDVNTLSF